MSPGPAQQLPHTADVSGASAQIDDWTFEYIRTLVTWLNYSNVNLFLIDMSIRYYKMILSHVMAYTLLFSTISSTISISQLGISKEAFPILYNGIQYAFIAASTLSTLLIGYVKLFKVQESLDANTVLYKNWLSFSTRISSEFQMPVHMRTSALTLLQDMKNEYIDLFCRNASIPFAVQRSANRYFQRNLGATPVTYGCWSRPNYIKRTNIFFIFHDIIKDEIKRLSAELTPITDYGADDDEYENIVPSYYQGGVPGGQGTPKIPKYIGPQAIIEYKYDGPFIVIEVRDRNDSAAFMRHKTRQAAAARRRQLKELSDDARRKVTLMSRLKAAAAAAAPGSAVDDSGDESRRGGGFLELLHVPMRRERQMSFSLPERSLMQRGVRSSGDLMNQARSQDQGSRPTPAAPAVDGRSSLTAESVSSASSTVSTEDVAIQVVPGPAPEPVSAEANTDSF
jgi:hypothetical protein